MSTKQSLLVIFLIALVTYSVFAFRFIEKGKKEEHERLIETGQYKVQVLPDIHIPIENPESISPN